MRPWWRPHGSESDLGRVRFIAIWVKWLCFRVFGDGLNNCVIVVDVHTVQNQVYPGQIDSTESNDFVSGFWGRDYISVLLLFCYFFSLIYKYTNWTILSFCVWVHGTGLHCDNILLNFLFLNTYMYIVYCIMYLYIYR